MHHEPKPRSLVDTLQNALHKRKLDKQAVKLFEQDAVRALKSYAKCHQSSAYRDVYETVALQNAHYAYTATGTLIAYLLNNPAEAEAGSFPREILVKITRQHPTVINIYYERHPELPKEVHLHSEMLRLAKVNMEATALIEGAKIRTPGVTVPMLYIAGEHDDYGLKIHGEEQSTDPRTPSDMRDAEHPDTIPFKTPIQKLRHFFEQTYSGFTTERLAGYSGIRAMLDENPEEVGKLLHELMDAEEPRRKKMQADASRSHLKRQPEPVSDAPAIVRTPEKPLGGAPRVASGLIEEQGKLHRIGTKVAHSSAPVQEQFSVPHEIRDALDEGDHNSFRSMSEAQVISAPSGIPVEGLKLPDPIPVIPAPAVASVPKTAHVPVAGQPRMRKDELSNTQAPRGPMRENRVIDPQLDQALALERKIAAMRKDASRQPLTRLSFTERSEAEDRTSGTGLTGAR